jgi:SAM-dependent methyltransferase
MIKQTVKKALNHLGYDIHKIEHPRGSDGPFLLGAPAAIEPAWPLPRRRVGPSDEAIRKEFAKFDLWHYAYEFEGGLSFRAHHNQPGLLSDASERPLQRFRHFMPYLVASQNGLLKGKRVLDIACNSGFWSIQCALMGADVTGFDGRPELIEQANLIKSITGTDNVEFRVLDFWDMSNEALGGPFDIVLNLGILYHLPKPLEALELTKSMARGHVLLDTGVSPANGSVIKLSWEEPVDIRAATNAGIVAYPSKDAINLMLKHIRASEWFEIPLRSEDMPPDYLDGRRASWLIKV